VTLRQWLNIHKRERVGRLCNFEAGDGAVDDFAKEAVGIEMHAVKK
jgi:hypothetical protein